MAKSGKGRSAKSRVVPKSIRTSVSLPSALHNTLALLAKDKKVSVAWIIRDAAEKYVADQWPLLEKTERALLR